MKILFSPSEKKFENNNSDTLQNNLLFSKLHETRETILNAYNSLIKNSTDEELQVFFELKSQKEIQKYKKDIYKTSTLKAIKRYDGVAFDYLKYNSMNNRSQEFIDENMIIFSNLFGPIKASDKIPLYKLKQGQKLPNLNIPKLYKDNFSEELDTLLQEEDVLDLRAGFYDKFYKPKKEYYTIKFLKNGKVVSHFAKAYRGVVAKEIAQNDIHTIKDFLNLKIKNVKYIETIQTKNKFEIIMEILG